MNNNERELERAGYDRWKLSNGDRDIVRAGRYGFVDYFPKPKRKEGICPCCDEAVYENSLFVEDEETEQVYHFSCYNYKVAEEEEEKENGK